MRRAIWLPVVPGQTCQSHEKSYDEKHDIKNNYYYDIDNYTSRDALMLETCGAVMKFPRCCLK